jgi:LysM repeat protein
MMGADLFPPLNLQVDDTLLLCSDGLTGTVSEDEIAATCSRVSPKEGAHQLVDMANDRGGPDNISVVIGLSYDETAATLALGRPSRLRVRGPARILFGVLVAVALAGGLIIGVLLLARGGDSVPLPAVAESPTAGTTAVAALRSAIPVTITPSVTVLAPSARYEVQQGDSWQSIADKLDVGLDALYWANRDFYERIASERGDPLCLQPGDSLVVPTSRSQGGDQLPFRLTEADACTRQATAQSPTPTPAQPSPTVSPTQQGTVIPSPAPTGTQE